MAQSSNGKLVCVPEFGTNKIAIIDTATDTVVTEFTADANIAARTHACWVTRDGGRLYATNTATNNVAGLDAKTGNLLFNLPVGDNPSEILVTPDGKTGYVTVRNEHKVKVIDLTIPALTGAEAFLGVGAQPDTIKLTPDLKTLVVALRGSPARVALVDTATLLATIINIPPHTTTGHQDLSAGGRFTFVAVEEPGGIAVIDNTTAKVVAIYPYPDGGRPHGVFYEPSQLK